MGWTQEEADRVYMEVRNRAMRDKAFREQVVKNPNAVIEKLSGKALPQGIKIRVLEADPKANLTFVLPRMIVTDELSPEDLEGVAGGVCDINYEPCIGYGCAAQARR